MALLLDTHVILWLEWDPQKIPSITRKEIAVSPLFVSIVSIWELAIKMRAGKLNLAERSLQDFINSFLVEYHCQLLNAELDDTYLTQKVPLIHRDPFDRILIAQSINNRYHLVSADRVFAAYPVKTIW